MGSAGSETGDNATPMSRRSDATAAISLIRARYTERELRRLFVDRRKDWLFENLGQMISAKPLTSTEAVWLGFEILADSAYLDIRYC